MKLTLSLLIDAYKEYPGQLVYAVHPVKMFTPSANPATWDLELLEFIERHRVWPSNIRKDIGKLLYRRWPVIALDSKDLVNFLLKYNITEFSDLFIDLPVDQWMEGIVADSIQLGYQSK